MAEPKGRKTGEHNALIVKLIADGAAMREQIGALEARLRKLEAQMATTSTSTSTGTAGNKQPPPLPRPVGPVAAAKLGGRRSVVDISEIAELVESIPPPIPRAKK
jgi:hypothetical protein